MRSDIISLTRYPRASTLTEHLSRTTKSALLPIDDLVDTLVVIPPDGGWGWVIVVMVFITYFFVDGLTYTFGIFLDEISETFNVHPTKVALASSLMSGFYFLVGPFTCAITNRYGFRKVGIAGGIVSSIAFLISTFFLNLNAFLICMGVICGIGFNMVYIPSLLIIGFYFEKWRALASAISLCGSSMGVIAFPPLVTLMEPLHWTWKFRILSGITLLISLCAFAFRPLKPIRIVDNRADNVDSTGTFTVERDMKQGGRRSIFKTYHNTMFPTASQYHDASSIFMMPQDGNQEDDVRTYSEQSVTKSTFLYKTDNQSINLSTLYELESTAESKEEHKKSCCRRMCFLCNKFFKSDTENMPPNTDNVNRPLYRDDIFYSGSVYALPEYSRHNVGTSEGPSTKMSAISYRLSVTRVATQRDIEQNDQCVVCPEAVLRTVATMLHLKLFKSPTFVVLTISGCFSMIGLYSPFIFLVERAIDMRIHQDWAKLLLTVVGISNTAGRILCGVLSWFPKVNSGTVTATTLVIAGITIIASNYLKSLGGQIAFCVIFGLNIASLTVLRAIMVVELLGLENLTNAFGITSMFFGIGCLIGVPVAAFIQNNTGKYDGSFIFCGCSILISGLLIAPLQRISDWEKRNQKP